MNTKLISQKALDVIDQYAHFRVNGSDGSGGSEPCAIPYFNNNHKIVRAGLRATIGKGSPRDIFDEVEIELAKNGELAPTIPIIPPGAVKGGSFIPGAIKSDSLKHFLVDHNIGIDCSGFAYYVLSAESESRGRGAIDRHLHFPFCHGWLGKIRSKMRPAENADVATFAHDKNSRVIPLSEIMPGDVITMLNIIEDTTNSTNTHDKIRDHIVVIHQIEYQNFAPITIHYSHSMAWPTDGEYGTGVRQGTITILDINKPLTEQKWSENYTFARAQKSLTEIRRLKWF